MSRRTLTKTEGGYALVEKKGRGNTTVTSVSFFHGDETCYNCKMRLEQHVDCKCLFQDTEFSLSPNRIWNVTHGFSRYG